jgi:hypothetical protein
MNAYDGCHITIQIPVDFGTEKEKELRQSFTQELPGLTLTIQSGESVAKPRIGAISIDDFAYVRSAKAAEEWRNAGRIEMRVIIGMTRHQAVETYQELYDDSRPI